MAKVVWPTTAKVDLPHVDPKEYVTGRLHSEPFVKWVISLFKEITLC